MLDHLLIFFYGDKSTQMQHQAAIHKRQGQAEVMYYIERMTDKADSEARYELFCEAGIAYHKTQS
jgi:hypothetical protein